VRDQRDQLTALADPTKQMETLRTLIAMVKPPESNSSNLIVEILREELRDTRKELRDIRTSSGQPKSLVEQIKEVKELSDMLKGSRGNPSGSGVDWGQVIVQTAEKFAPALTMLTANLLSPKSAAVGVPGTGPAWQPQPTASGPQTSSEIPAALAAVVPMSKKTEPDTPAGEQPSEEDMKTAGERITFVLQKHGATIQKCIPFMEDLFKTGQTGYDLRDWFISREGLIKWTELKNDCGAETLCALAQGNPLLRAMFQPPEKLLAFLTEFFTEHGAEPDGVVDDGEESDNVRAN
jgi:hypothetical protein